MTLWVTVIGTWIFIFCVDMFGPVILQKPDQGPFFGISGYWCVCSLLLICRARITSRRCWITSNYPRARVFLEYMFVSCQSFQLAFQDRSHAHTKMFVSAFFCAIIHSIVFLRLRGNLSGDGWRNIRFRRIPRSERWALKLARDEIDSKMYKVAMQLMW